MSESMPIDRALLLARAWCEETRESFGQHLVVNFDGSFQGCFGAADIIYDHQAKELAVFGLVVGDASRMAEHPFLFENFGQAGKLESHTLGEGEFFILREPVRGGPPQLTLRKAFTDPAMEPVQFVKEVNWLMQWSTYWRIQRSLAVMGRSEEQLALEGPEIDAQARENQPRPW